ncbi:MAG: HAD-IA family hydrolase [Patescibacteria group bacterium]
MVKAIILDCFGVLTTDKWREFVATLPEQQRRPASDLNHAFDAGHITKAEFFQSVEELTGNPPQGTDEILYGEAHKNTDLLELIAQLKPNYRIGLLSNVASNWPRDQFLTADERALFDDFILSYEVHMAKPDPRIFALAAERLGVSPEECVLIDDVDYYCGVAKDQGMHAICYTDFQQTKLELEKLLG